MDIVWSCAPKVVINVDNLLAWFLTTEESYVRYLECYIRYCGMVPVLCFWLCLFLSP